MFFRDDLLLQRGDGTLCGQGGGALLVGLLRDLIDAPRGLVILILQLLCYSISTSSKRASHTRTCIRTCIRTCTRTRTHMHMHTRVAHLNSASPVGFVQLPVAGGFPRSLLQALNSFL